MSETLRPDGGAPSPDPLLGQVIGGAYRIDRLLGSGGMGNVYEASHIRLPKRFAVKVVRGELARDPQAFERFKREAEIASSLGNKHIVEVFDFNVLEDGSPYMVMEFLTGEDLATRLGRLGRLSPDEANALLSQVVSALDAAHARGIVHRDIKPENIFITQTDEEADFVKLLDFGLSKIRGSQKRLTANLSVLGTPWYMSPEQARGDADLDHRTDLYALAVVLYQVLCGRVPFDGDNVYGVLTQIATQSPPPIRQFAPELPAELEAVLSRAMSKDPGHRYASVREFWEAAQGASGATVVRRSFPPSARVSGPDGKPFRVPTPSGLNVGTAPTINATKDQLASSPIPLTRRSDPNKGPSSPSMMAVEQAAFPSRSNKLPLVAGIAVGVAVFGALAWHFLRPAEKAEVTQVAPALPQPEPQAAVAPPAPKPAVAEMPKPAVAEPPAIKPPPVQAVAKPPEPSAHPPAVMPAVSRPTPPSINPAAKAQPPRPSGKKPRGKSPKKGAADDLIQDI